jgi:hypothetical protein
MTYFSELLDAKEVFFSYRRGTVDLDGRIEHGRSATEGSESGAHSAGGSALEAHVLEVVPKEILRGG